MKIWKTIGAVALMAVFALPAKAQQEDKYEKVGDKVQVTRYYEDGSVKEVGTFNNGTPDGRWVEYTRDGNIKIEATYVNGEKAGTWFVWSEDGESLYEVVYQDNRLQNANRWKIAERNSVANN